MNNSHTMKMNEVCRESLLEALLILMKKEPLEKISITNLCKKAGVSRMAFYKNYEVKEDILIRHFDHIADNLIKKFQTLKLESSYESSIIMFNTIKEESDFFLTVFFKSRNEKVINQMFFTFSKAMEVVNFPYELEDDDIQPFIYYRGGGLVYLIIYWLENGMKETPEKMATLATKFDMLNTANL